MESERYNGCMAKRIKTILLVCNNYDNFALAEDGRIDVQIAQDYMELNLSNPPSITRAETPEDALEMVRAGQQYDLVITMYSAGTLAVQDFAAQMKQLQPEAPFVLLSSFSRELLNKLHLRRSPDIDYFFCWNSSADLIIAIIKLIEDRMNAEQDILEAGVRAIILVEDSVRYYSTYLPVLYKLILQQNAEAVRDALNEKQQLMRKRARPKVLMATCYDEAEELYWRYKHNILGVISDVGFVQHKNDLPEAEDLEAGVRLCEMIRNDNPTMPILMQSSQESMREVADRLNVGFIVKKSKALTHELSDYIVRHFGFGDFVVTNEETGEIVARASDLEGVERILRTISVSEYFRLATNNYISKWLFGRGLFAIGKQVKAHNTTADNVEKGRQEIVKMLHDYRIHQALGVVATFNKDTFNDAIWFSRLGSSSLGGKARGLAFLNHALQQRDLYKAWDGIRVLVPRTLVITTEYFDRFIAENGLQYVINAELQDEDVLQEFVASRLPDELVDALRAFIRVSHKPMAIRSSSKLEDNYYQPFAGVYSTYMVPHVDNEDQMIRLLGKAIKQVYASVFFAGSRGYITSSGNVISEEKMALVIQEVCGAEQAGYYLPTLSGVARSVNFYPVGYEKAEDGIVKMAFGLGKAVVDGEQVLRFSPRYPKHVMQTSTPDLAMRETQQTVLALDLRPEQFRTSTNDAVNLARLTLPECEKLPMLKKVASTFDMQNFRMVDSCAPQGPRYITFAPILKYKTYPIADILSSLLEIAVEEMKCPVELEFAADLTREPAMFHVLQIRPISADSLRAQVDWDKVDTDQPLLTSGNALGIGEVNEVCDIIYLRQENFDVLKTQEMATVIRKLNAEMRSSGRGYVLIGYGRWGSSISSLGVPVQWSDISEARAIVECCLENFRVDPSQGSHFFQNLTSFNVGYINVDPFARRDSDSFDQEQLDKLPAEYEDQFVRHVRLSQPLRMYIDGFKNKAFIGF
ncbi:MAG: phosphoenolpyruvate synthase [Paludibacteraceae bacterium]|nr:phosphoenolpyruvate synthase [Paludibacteraceae bacterium]